MNGLEHYLLRDETAQTVGRWLRQLGAGRDVPDYGSTVWLAADRDVQIASCVRAAEAWRRSGLFLVDDLTDQVRRSRELALHHEQVEAEHFAVLARRIQAMANEPSYAVLAERRRVVA